MWSFIAHFFDIHFTLSGDRLPRSSFFITFLHTEIVSLNFFVTQSRTNQFAHYLFSRTAKESSSHFASTGFANKEIEKKNPEQFFSIRKYKNYCFSFFSMRPHIRTWIFLAFLRHLLKRFFFFSQFDLFSFWHRCVYFIIFSSVLFTAL